MPKNVSENGCTRKELQFDLRQKTRQLSDAQHRVSVLEQQIKAIQQEIGTLPVKEK